MTYPLRTVYIQCTSLFIIYGSTTKKKIDKLNKNLNNLTKVNKWLTWSAAVFVENDAEDCEC